MPIICCLAEASEVVSPTKDCFTFTQLKCELKPGKFLQNTAINKKESFTNPFTNPIHETFSGICVSSVRI
jgi:hypothetical protein